MSIKIENLTKKYKNQFANLNINLQINKGEIIGLLGPNGAGKSTFMKSIVGALSFDEGSIIIDGISVLENLKEYKNKIGFLAENNPLYLEMYVKEYLYFVADILKVNHTKINEIIDLVGLSNEASKKISQLSKGYKQRVGLAQAIMNNPDYLILDEPTSGLDPNQIIEIRNLIKNLGKDKTVILSTHIMQEVEAICNRVILINKGEIIQDCSIESFKGKFDNLEQAFYTYTNENI